jgi:glutathione S-transferase
MRCLWMLEEMGEPYRLIEKSTRADDLQSTDYLRLNPNARIPTLVDGDVVLWQSMAINLYLAQKYEGPMHCAGRRARPERRRAANATRVSRAFMKLKSRPNDTARPRPGDLDSGNRQRRRWRSAAASAPKRPRSRHIDSHQYSA